MEVDASVVYQDVNPTVFTHQSLPQLPDLPDISDIQSEELGPEPGRRAELHPDHDLVA